MAEPSVFWSVPLTVTGGPPAVIITSLALIRSWLGTTKLLNVCPCSQPKARQPVCAGPWPVSIANERPKKS